QVVPLAGARDGRLPAAGRRLPEAAHRGGGRRPRHRRAGPRTRARARRARRRADAGARAGPGDGARHGRAVRRQARDLGLAAGRRTPGAVAAREAALSFDGRQFAATLPRRPGVYRMYGSDTADPAALLYVGKAASLRDRVGSYFQSGPHAPKVEVMLRQVRHIEVTVTANETEALLLEYNLIKQHRP